MADIITCPSGLPGRVRGMKVREERVLADRKLAESGGQSDELLAACWEETPHGPEKRAREPSHAAPILGWRSPQVRARAALRHARERR
ncbi:MAG: hypothetical protein RL385_4422 [Pseudomonadota bacterium]|jgi:hypothetical protein